MAERDAAWAPLLTKAVEERQMALEVAAWLCARLAAGLIKSPRVRTRIGSLRSGHAGGPSEWCCRYAVESAVQKVFVF